MFIFLHREVIKNLIVYITLNKRFKFNGFLKILFILILFLRLFFFITEYFPDSWEQTDLLLKLFSSYAHLYNVNAIS